MDNSSAHVTELNLTLRIAKASLLIPIFAIGLIGNVSLCSIIITSRDMRTRTYTFLMNLAVANAGIALLCIPFNIITLTEGNWILGDTMCSINGILNPFLLSASVFSITAATIHKYFSVLKPLKRTLSKSRVVISIVMVWSGALFCASWPIVKMKNIIYKPIAGQCGLNYPTGKREVLQTSFFIGSGFLAPVLINIFCYLRIFRAVRMHRRRIQRSSVVDLRGLKAQRKIIMTFYILFISYGITWTPFCIYAVIYIFRQDSRLSDYFLSLSYFFAFSTCAQSPVILVYRSRRLQEGFKSIFSAIALQFGRLKCTKKHSSPMRASSRISTLSFSSHADLDRRCSCWYISSQPMVLSLVQHASELPKSYQDRNTWNIGWVETYV